MFNDELSERVTNTIVNLDERVGELERKETLTSGDGIGPFRYEVHVDINGGGDFLSIKAACDYVAAQDSVGVVEWLIWVHPGDYEESPFTIPEFTTLWGLGGTGINGGGANISPSAGTMTSGTFISISSASALVGNLFISASVSPSVGNTYLISGTGQRLVINGIQALMSVSLASANAAATIQLTDAATYEIHNATIKATGANTGSLRAVEITVLNSIGNEGFIRGSRIWRNNSSARAIYYDGAGLVPAVPNKLYILETTINPIGTDIHAFSGTIILRATQYTTSTGSGTISQMYTSGTGTGTVTSVAMSVPSFLSVAGSPITTSGTFAVTLATQSANRVFAGPTSGGAATPTFRALVAADIPNLDASKIATGSFGVSRGAIGITSYTIGDLIYASGATTLSALADVATGNALISGGVGVAPLWDKIGLTTHVSGILPGPNGGTGLGTFAADLMLYSSAIDTWATTAITAFARSVLDDTTAAAARTTLGAIGGSGAADRVTLWSDASTVTSNANLTFASNLLSVVGKLFVGAGTATGNPTLELRAAAGSNPTLDLRDGDFSGNTFGSIFLPDVSDDTIGRVSPFGVGGLVFNGFAPGATTVVPLTLAGYSTTTGTTTVPAVLIVGWKSNGTNLRQAIAGSEILLQLQAGLSTSYTTGTFPMTVYANGNVGLGTATPGAHLDIFKTTGGIARLSRNDTTIAANEMIGKVEFYGDDSDLSTQGIFGNIEVQALAAIGSDAASGKMLLRTTGLGTGTSPVERLALGCVKNLTDAATSLFDVTLNSGEMAGGAIHWTIVATDGTDHQAYSGIAVYAAVNKAGTYTTQITHNTSNDAKAVSSGTLTASWTVLNGTNKVTIRVTPAGSLTETTYRIIYSVLSDSPQVITIL